MASAEQADGERDGDDERGGVVGALEPAEQPLHDQADDGHEHEHDDGDGERRGTPWFTRSSK